VAGINIAVLNLRGILLRDLVFLSVDKMLSTQFVKGNKGKAIPVTGREGP
jgi:hypothetical protein